MYMSAESFSGGERRAPPYKNKTEYFSALATKYQAEMKFLMGVSKLGRRDELGHRVSATDKRYWANVTEHCLVEAAASEALTHALGLSLADTQAICKAAAVHDWDKRITKKPQEFTAEESAKVQAGLQKINADQNLLFATGPEFLEAGLMDNKATFPQKVLYYVDLICEGSTIMPLEQRLARAKERWPELAQNDPLNKKLEPLLGPGKNYFDAEVVYGNRTQQEIFDLLVARGHALQSPQEVPQFIEATVKANYTP